MLPRNFRPVLSFHLISLLIIILASAPPARSAPPPQTVWANGTSFVLVPSLVRIGQYPVSVGALKLGEEVPYMFSLKGGRLGDEIPLPQKLHEISAASLSPNAKWVAYTAREGVWVTDLDGRVLFRDEKATRCRWSRDGESLAFLPDHGVGIWNGKRKTTRYVREDADDIAWGTRDSLFAHGARRVWATDASGGRISETKHHGAGVSPDGLYSIDHPPGYWSGARIVHDRSGTDLSSAVFAALGSCAPKQYAEPFWVPAAGHYLCVSMCGEWLQADGSREWACRTGIVDVLTSELAVAWPGMSLSPSADGESVWITDGDALLRYSLRERTFPSRAAAGRPEWAPNFDQVRVLIRTREWSHTVSAAAAGRVEEASLTMRIGDILPHPYPRDGTITLVDIPGAHRAVFRMVGTPYVVKQPGDRFRNLDFFDVNRAPVTLSDQASDGGYIVELSTLP